MDYLEGVLGSPEREALAAHVAGCPRCVAFVDSYRGRPDHADRHGRGAAGGLATSLRRFLAAGRSIGPSRAA